MPHDAHQEEQYQKRITNRFERPVDIHHDIPYSATLELGMLPPEQLLEHAYAYAVRSDIVIAIECGSIHARQAQSLLKSENALDEIFGKWEDFEKNHMDTVRRAIECKANEISREEFKKEVQERKARERDER